MKKYRRIFVSLMVFIFVFSTPMHILAATDSDNTLSIAGEVVNDTKVKKYVVDKSIEAFPEFASKIKGENTEEIQTALLRRSGIGEAVYTETRRISDNEIVTYTEYDSGIVATAFGLMEGKNVTNSYQEGNRWTYVMNVWLQYGGSESVLFVQGLKYEIYTNGYDRIAYTGDRSTKNNTAIASMEEEYIEYETASAPAKVQYGASFAFNVNYGDLAIPYYLYAHLIVEVENNTCTISSKAE